MDAYHQQWLSFKETAAALADLKKKKGSIIQNINIRNGKSNFL